MVTTDVTTDPTLKAQIDDALHKCTVVVAGAGPSADPATNINIDQYFSASEPVLLPMSLSVDEDADRVTVWKGEKG
ncbi:hypothetical protein AJ80_05841 [Polytolypa hystricis UAMH7299]|uniref:Uncharacterized protein n=1 Tax=Polytolypa hystricis (strain UAMH7299) TaxID=1447883 RepID=A0A2B7Y055_POLH7|nr:hypothetical protein AJ80_05841 [Polytolypa hystricis UAMH7299]